MSYKKINFVEIKYSCVSEDTMRKKDNPQNKENICKSYIW